MKVVTIGIAQAVPTTIGRNEYYLLFNGHAMFEIEEAVGSDYFSQVLQRNADGIKAAAKCMEIMARQGELARRAAGLKPHDFLKGELLEFGLSPVHITAVANALTVGMGRQLEDDDEEIDLILLEQQKKRKQSK